MAEYVILGLEELLQVSDQFWVDTFHTRFGKPRIPIQIDCSHTCAFPQNTGNLFDSSSDQARASQIDMDQPMIVLDEVFHIIKQLFVLFAQGISFLGIA